MTFTTRSEYPAKWQVWTRSRNTSDLVVDFNHRTPTALQDDVVMVSLKKAFTFVSHHERFCASQGAPMSKREIREVCCSVQGALWGLGCTSCSLGLTPMGQNVLAHMHGCAQVPCRGQFHGTNGIWQGAGLQTASYACR